MKRMQQAVNENQFNAIYLPGSRSDIKLSPSPSVCEPGEGKIKPGLNRGVSEPGEGKIVRGAQGQEHREREGEGVMGSNRRMIVGAAVAGAVIAGGWVMVRNGMEKYGWDWDQRGYMKVLTEMRDWMGYWAIPAYVALHTLTLTLCLPYAVFFEAGASLLFGFFPALLCVFSAKILGASLSFSLGRLIFRSSSTAMKWAQRNRYFHLLSRGVERDGWKFVLLARFSPIPSYVINYALSATKIGFIVDFLLPTVIGCLPMILQNTSIGSLAGAAVASAAGTQKPKIWSYIFPLIGISSSILISLRIKRYSTNIPVTTESSLREDIHDYNNNASSAQTSSSGK